MYYLVVNPVAGRGRARLSYHKVKHFFAQKDLPLSTFFTERPGQATDYTKSLPLNATVIVLGGDGTLHEVAAACIYTERTLGVLPAGSGDDFAYALGIPRHNLEAALAVIERGRSYRVDTAEVNGQPFINAFGVGFDADVAYSMKYAPTLLKGNVAYYYAVLATLGRLESCPVTVNVDGITVFQGPALLVATQNGPRTGGSFLFAPDAKLEDGVLDIIVAGAVSRLETLNLLPQVIKGNHLAHPKIIAFKGREVRLRWMKPRPGHMEGEILAPSRSFSIKVRPKSLAVLAL